MKRTARCRNPVRRFAARLTPAFVKRRLRELPGLRVDPAKQFTSPHYVRNSQRRLEHLASLGLPLARRSVLEVGAGVGEHTSFFLDRGCDVFSTDARPQLVRILRRRYPGVRTRLLNLDYPDREFHDSFDIVYCYGVLYHLAKPAEALEFMARHCNGLLLLETQVSYGAEELIHRREEDTSWATTSVSGFCCAPTRPWVFSELKRHFQHVYATVTQPWHEEFPLDWDSSPPAGGPVARSVFVASREPLNNPTLSDELPPHQVRA